MRTGAALGLVLAAAVAGTALRLPAVTRLLPPCPVAALTGLSCPGCGSGRAFAALARGDLAAAVGFNPLLLLALPCAGALAVLEARARGRGEPLVLPAWTVRLFAGAVGLFTLARNLPGFEILGP